MLWHILCARVSERCQNAAAPPGTARASCRGTGRWLSMAPRSTEPCHFRAPNRRGTLRGDARARRTPVAAGGGQGAEGVHNGVALAPRVHPRARPRARPRVRPRVHPPVRPRARPPVRPRRAQVQLQTARSHLYLPSHSEYASAQRPTSRSCSGTASLCFRSATFWAQCWHHFLAASVRRCMP